MAGQPDFKKPRIVDPEAGKAKVEREGRCRVCRLRSSPVWKSGDVFTGLSRHHLVPKGRGGDDVDENIIPLCGGGTTGCHGLAEHKHLLVLQEIRATMLPEEKAYVIAIATIGEAGLDRHYPKGATP